MSTSTKPIFVATHPRACSTAFERVFMTRHETMQCLHEPFGDAFYYGTERMGERFESDEASRTKSGFSQSAYKTIFDRIDREGKEGKRLFIKDMAYYLCPTDGEASNIAPSLQKTGASKDQKNPTVIPDELLSTFDFAFLIRHPRSSIPSYYRCCVPPLSDKTGWSDFLPSEAGYRELRHFFDYCKETGMIGPQNGAQDASNGTPNAGGVKICVIDADDLLDDPEGILRQFCACVGVEFDAKMLDWSDADTNPVRKAFQKWDGWHEDAIGSQSLKPRQNKVVKSDGQLYEEWSEKYGVDGAEFIKKTVAENTADYEYLKSFAIAPSRKPN